MATRQQQGWCFTLNNPGNASMECMHSPELKYSIYQHERGAQGTEHYQGYVHFIRSRRFSYVKSFLPAGSHIEPANGTAAQNKVYCSKDDTRIGGPFEFGQVPFAGKRNDIASFKDAIDSGATDEALWDTCPGAYLRYARMVPVIRSMKQPKRSWKTEVYILYGLPGTGKSEWCKQNLPDAYWKPTNCIWFCGYTGQEDVVIDEYKAWIQWNELLRLMDSTPCKVQTKGGSVEFTARRLFFTTNFHPREWYGTLDNASSHPFDALGRRIDHFWKFTPGIGWPHQMTKEDGSWNVDIEKTAKAANEYSINFVHFVPGADRQ